MKNPVPALIGLLALVGLGVGALVFVLRESPEPSVAVAPAAAEPGPSPEGSARLTAPEPEPAAGEPEPAATRTEVADPQTAFGEAEWEEEDSLWVQGRVVLPEGLPADEQVEVFASSEPQNMAALARVVDSGKRSLPQPWLARVRAAADGSFRLPFPPDTETGHVMCFGRYVYSDRSVAVALAEEPAEPLALQAIEGTLVRGLIVRPDDAEDLVGLEVRLVPDLSGGITDFDLSSFVRREVDVDEDLRFEFRAVFGPSRYTLQGRPERFASFHLPLTGMEPGQVHELRIELTRGGSVSGLVRDEEGRPVAGAEIEALQDVRMMMGNRGRKVRETESAEDGTFALAAVASGETLLRANHDEFLESSEKVTVVEGAEVGSVEVVLDRGKRVAGVVLWPDGRPVEEAEVDLSFDMSRIGGMEGLNALRGAEGEAETDAEGRFSIGGLGGGPFTVRVEARAPGSATPEAEHPQLEEWPDPEGDGHSDEQKIMWTARANGVAPNTTDLVLTLTEPLGLHGRVVDESGEPVKSFTVQGITKTSGMIPGMGAETQRDSFEDEQGRFFLTGLVADTWNVTVMADGYAMVEPLQVEVPQAPGEELRVTLQAAASVSGRVVDPDGLPVSNAKVAQEVNLSNMMDQAFTMDRRPAARSDAEGRFTIDGLRPGSTSLVASSDRSASSAPVSVEAASGEHVEGVVLALRIGGRITGEVFDDEGELAAGMQVMAQMPGAMIMPRMQTSDANGWFEFDRLAPGNYQVFSMGAGGAESMMDEDADFGESFSKWKFTTTEVVDGQEVHVVLGAPPQDPVKVSGRVTHGGQPASKLVVNFLPEGEANRMASLRLDSTDVEGAYELTLDRPGAYLVTVQKVGAMGAQNSLEFTCDVPESEEHRFDMELPIGRITGRVLGPDGAPAAGARVSLTNEGPIPSASMLGGRYTEIATDDDGRYAVEWVRPGSYTLAVGGSLFGGMFGGDSAIGRQVRQGIEVREGQTVAGVDFRLREGATITGVVRDAAGKPVAEAAVFVRDEGGRLLERLSMLQTDGSGRFTYKGVQPGHYTVSARKDDLASQESAPATAREDQPATVEVRLEAGTKLVVVLEDREGNPVEAAVSVLDAEGRQVNGMLSMQELLAAFQEGAFTSTEHQVGPLAAGTYRVLAVAPDGKRAEKPVSLDGQPERRLKLRLRD